MSSICRRVPLYASTPLLAAAVLLGGCAFEDAPPSLNQVFKDSWTLFEPGTDEEMAELMRDIVEVVDFEALAEDRQRGSQERLSQAEINLLEFKVNPPEVDAALARPVYLLERYACTIDQLVPLLTYPDQNELYNTYEDYGRTFASESDRQAFIKGTSNTLSWSGFLETNIFVGAYVYDFRTDIRRVPVPDGVGLKGGHMLMTRNWLPAPAEWLFGNHSFPQDYQLEIWVPVSATEVVHLYPVWREMSVAGLGSMEQDSFAQFNVDKMVDWGNRTAELCAEGLP